MDWLNVGDFLIGLIGLIVGLFPTGHRILKDYWKKLRFKRLFGDPDRACIVIPVHPDPTIDRVPRIHRMVKVETTMAVLRLRDHLEQLGWMVTIRPSRDPPHTLEMKCMESTMFFLGSTRATSVATDLFPKLRLEFSFEERELEEPEDDGCEDEEAEDKRQKDKERKTRPVIVEKGREENPFRSPMDDKTPKGADLALVIKIDNHYCPARSAFWLAGIHAIGTWGATEFLCSDEGLREILPRVRSENFATVIRAEFTGLDEEGHKDPSRLLNLTKYEVERIPRFFPLR